MRNLKKYSNHSGYSADERALGCNISICKSENHTHYDKTFPYDSKVVYIDIPANAYIDSGIIPTDSTGFSYIGQRFTSPAVAFIGYRHTHTTTQYLYVYGYNSVGVFSHNNINTNVSYSSVTTDYDQLVEYKMNLYNSRRVACDDIVSDYVLPSLSFVPNSTMYVGAVHVSSNDALQSSGRTRCYGCIITEGDKIVRDYVPVRIGQVGYLFDRVSGQLFGNAGTGTITVGNDTV